MKRILTRVIAKAGVLALAFSTVFSVAPIRAAAVSSVSDTLDRQKISETATHQVAATFPAGTTWDAGEQVVFDYSSAGFALADSTPSCSLGTGTCHAIVASATDSLVIECDATNCSGVLTLGTFTGTNPGTAGSKSVSISTAGGDGDGNITGSLSIAIVDDDQVTVTATVAETMTFDLDVGTTTSASSSAPYTVDLGSLTTSDVASSGTTDNINMIGVDVDTNASGGAVVQVRNANGANGLTSTSAPSDTIDAVSSTTLTAGTEGYGICVYQVSATTGTFRSAGFHNGGTLSATANTTTSSTCDQSTHQISTGLTTSFQDILNSNSAAVSSGRGEIFVKAAISTTTAAHDDYTDTLTFRATATF